MLLQVLVVAFLNEINRDGEIFVENIDKSWLKEDSRKCKIEELKRLKRDITDCSAAYMDIFNGAPFFESWDLDSALKVVKSYVDEDAIMLSAKCREQIIGFLVAIDGVPENQRQYVQFLENIKFIEEIGVLYQFRKNGIASEMVRILLLKYLKQSDRYLGYRTNAMRYFEYDDSESFESAVMRVQNDDMIKRANGEKIVIPDFSFGDKQTFINKYIELIKNRPDLDVSNSNNLFRKLFGTLDYSEIDGDYSFQKDPTGEGNDRIFPVIDLSKTLHFSKRR